MKTFSSKSSLMIGYAFLTFFLTGCGSSSHPHSTNKPLNFAQSDSRTLTVDIPITKVKDQRRVGFCWSYAIAALVESQYLLRTDQTINISEEALGFFRMAEELSYLSQNFSGNDLNNALDSSILDGYWAINTNNPYLDAFQLVQKYGLVPDGVWSYKFGGTNDVLGDQKIAAIKKSFKALMKGKTPGSVSMDTIISQALISSGAYPSKPPSKFIWEGKNYSSIEFGKDFLKFDPASFDIVIGRDTASFDSMISALKRTLASGKPALMSFDVYNSFVNTGDLSAGTAPFNDPRYADNYGGRHMVLVTDFVNVGARPGGMTQSQIQTEVNKSSESLDYIVFKNSWGYGNWNSSSRRMVEPGMFTMDKSYIKGNLANGAWELIVPKTFVDNPTASYSIPSKITGIDELSDKELTRTKNFTITADELNCRSLPGIEQPIVTALRVGDSVLGYSFEKDSLGQQWMKVKTGYIANTDQSICYVRALKSYVNLNRLGEISCPQNFQLNLVGRELGKYCMDAKNEVLGPFTKEMIEKCIAWGGGENTCQNAKTWGQKLAIAARGNGRCALGTFYDYDVDYCSDGESVYGPFPAELVKKCLNFTNQSAACQTGRWSRKVLFFLQRSEN